MNTSVSLFLKPNQVNPCASALDKNDVIARHIIVAEIFFNIKPPNNQVNPCASALDKNDVIARHIIVAEIFFNIKPPNKHLHPKKILI